MKKTIRNKWTVALATLGVVGLPSAISAQNAADTNQVAQASGTNAPATTPSGTVIGSKANESFIKRLGQAFHEQLGTASYVEPTPPAPGSPPAPVARRAAPAPFDSPPYPNGEWQIGGTEVIGDPNLTPDYPLMQALYEGPHGDFFAGPRIKLYGWMDISGNYSTSHQSGLGPNGQAGNFPLIYPQRPDRVELDQAVLYIERTPDEAQTDHVDWGFRVSGVYGLDYRYMISYGLFSDQLLKGNRFYGFDMPMIYGNLYFPKVAQGLNITIGRIISEADIEAQ
ncbi:MAG TPA: outer membrane beta-barrel protein, partial [Verrucomicrobiae bacterium]|nr:outer membrane beta-barrel protein [Verrucomicrobiae bacterium]